MAKRRWLRRMLIALALLGGLLGLGLFVAWKFLAVPPQNPYLKQPELSVGPAAVTVASDQLCHTAVVAHLDAPMVANRNLLWCATAQIAWNELCRAAGGPVRMEGEVPLVELLNRQQVGRSDLDESALVALAGPCGPEMAKKLQKEIERKLGAGAAPMLLEAAKAAPPGELVAYSCFRKSLPYEWAFKRLGRAVSFRGSRVDCFGIHQYLDSDEQERKAAAQVHLCDYKGKDDFIIEIDTRAKGDQLVLAKVPPAPTLKDLVESVSRRMAAAQPETGLDELADLNIPVIDFDIMHDYAELCGRPITAPKRELSGKRLVECKQSIRFRLDEKGAELLSDCVMALGLAKVRDLVFDQPFLVLIRKREAKSPYLVLWIDNPELLGTLNWNPPPGPEPAEGSARSK